MTKQVHIVAHQGKVMAVNPEEYRYWHAIWWAAVDNMPSNASSDFDRDIYLRKLLGKAAPDPEGVDSHPIWWLAGDPEGGRLLRLLAGPHGKTLAKAMAIQKGIDLKD